MKNRTSTSAILNKLLVHLMLLLTMSFAVACGQNDQAASAAEAVEGSEAQPQVPEPTAAPVRESSSMSEDELVAAGEKIFQETAGGIGCQACHGRDALGDVGPNIVGKSAETIQTQLDTNEAMQFIILSSEDIEALAAYLDWLAEQQ
jgi:mono/diheme cytochrome c family protein